MATLNDNALTTLAAIEDELPGFTAGGGSDDRMIRYVNEVSDLIERAANRRFYYAEAYVERTQGYGDHRLIVKDHLPLASIDTIHWDDGETRDLIESDDYRIADAEAGFIEVVEGRWHDTDVYRWEIERHPTHQDMRWWEVSYTGGWVTPQQDANDPALDRTLPYDLERAALEYVAMRDGQRGRDPTVTSISLDRGSISYAEVDGMQVPASVKSIVSRYRFRGA